MPDPDSQLENISEDQRAEMQKVLSEADRLAAEVEAEVMAEQSIGAMPSIDELTPEMLENMDPAQLQAIIRNMQAAEGPTRKAQSHYTRKQTSKAVRKNKRTAQKAARAITRNNGGGRTVSKLSLRGSARSR